MRVVNKALHVPSLRICFREHAPVRDGPMRRSLGPMIASQTRMFRHGSASIDRRILRYWTDAGGCAAATRIAAQARQRFSRDAQLHRVRDRPEQEHRVLGRQLQPQDVAATGIALDEALLRRGRRVERVAGITFGIEREAAGFDHQLVTFVTAGRVAVHEQQPVSGRLVALPTEPHGARDIVLFIGKLRDRQCSIFKANGPRDDRSVAVGASYSGRPSRRPRSTPCRVRSSIAPLPSVHLRTDAVRGTHRRPDRYPTFGRLRAPLGCARTRHEARLSAMPDQHVRRRLIAQLIRGTISIRRRGRSMLALRSAFTARPTFAYGRRHGG